MSGATAFEVQRQGAALAVRGELTFDTAHAALVALRDQLRSGDVATLDLSGVRRSDSAGLSCVLAVLADAATRGDRLALRDVPDGMRRLAWVCAADAMLDGPIPVA